MRKRTVFLIVCAAIFAAGIMLTFVGFAIGGIQGIDRVAEKHDWIKGSPGNVETDMKEYGEFESIEIDTSNGDVILVGENALSDALMLGEIPGELWGYISDNAKPEPGNVSMIYGENLDKPEVTKDNGVLKIKDENEKPGITFDFSTGDKTPAIIVVCGDNIKDIDVKTAYGDIEAIGVSAGEFNASSSDGDIDIVGSDLNKTVVKVDLGDVVFASYDEESAYTINAKTAIGDIEVNEKDISEAGGNYNFGSGSKTLEINTGDGDIELLFGHSAMREL